MSKKIYVVTILLLVIVTLALAFALTTYAIWREQVTAQENIRADVAYYNPSLKHIVFGGLNENGQLTTVQEEIVAYAAVGYTGLVTEVELPETYISPNDPDARELPVTALLIDPSDLSIAFSSSRVVRCLILPKTLILVETGACTNMRNLTSIIVKGMDTDAALVINSGAFTGHSAQMVLSTPDGRTVVGLPI